MGTLVTFVHLKVDPCTFFYPPSYRLAFSRDLSGMKGAVSWSTSVEIGKCRVGHRGDRIHN